MPKRGNVAVIITVIVLGLLIGLGLWWRQSRSVERANQSGNQEVGVEKPQKQIVRVFVVALEDKGQSGKQIGCEDSVVAVEREVTTANLETAISELLSINEKYYGESGLYNAVFQEGVELALESAIVASGKATIRLTGDYKFTGVCEDARFIAQIEETAKQFTEVTEVEIWLNGESLKNLYKGE